jgi:PBSX family phage terminase large subunit
VSDSVNIKLSQKQADVYANYKNKEWTIMAGTIRSGKTYVQHLILLDYLYSPACIKNEDIIISGKAGDSLERNIVGKFLDLTEAVGRGKDFHYQRQPRKIMFKPKKLDMWIIGANDEGSEERVRGMTSQALVGDECTSQNKACFMQQVARTSAGSRLKLLTTNPDIPTHWFKTTFIDNDGVDSNYYEFDLRHDNPVIDKKYIAILESTMTEMEKKRFLEGQWFADSESLIIPEFYGCEKDIVKESFYPDHCTKMVSMDLGMVDDTCIVFGYYDFMRGKKVIQDSIYLKHPTTLVIAEAIRGKEKELWGENKPYARFSDTNLHVIHDLCNLHGLLFSPTAKDDKQAQINAFRVSIQNGEYEIHPKNKKLINQLRIGTWNKSRKSFLRTEEDGHYDGIDSCVYFDRNISKYTHINPFPFGVSVKPQTHHINKGFWDHAPKSDSRVFAECMMGVS